MTGNAEILFYRGKPNQSPQKVKEIQSALALFKYYTGSIDGDFGPLTEKAVKAFQASPECVNGTVDKCTHDKLINLAKRLTSSEASLVNIKKYYLQADEYISAPNPLDRESITLHWTGGGKNAHWVQGTWEQDNYNHKFPVATHFIVSGEDGSAGQYATYDGQILQVIPLARGWAYHVNHFIRNNQHNIGIEICGYANLKKVGTHYVNAYGGLVPESEVRYFEHWGVQYWQKITEEQYEATQNLILELCKKYPRIAEGISKQTFDENFCEYQAISPYTKPQGLFVHTNFTKPPNRMDIPPFPEFIEMLNNVKKAL